MCHTTKTTHMLCMHTITSTSPCTSSLTPPTPFTPFSLLSLFLSSPTPKPKQICKPSTGEIFLNDFCPSCQNFWSQLGTHDTEARNLTLSYRQETNYYGSLAPFPGSADGEVNFFQEDLADGEARYAAQFNAWWAAGSGGLAGVEEQREDVIKEQREDGVEKRVRKALRSRQSSGSSTVTLWPAPSVRKMSEADIRDQRLMGEVDEFGMAVEMPVPTPGFLLKNEFELVDHGGFERQEVTRPVRPFPKSMPQRVGFSEAPSVEPARGTSENPPENGERIRVATHSWAA